MLKAFSFLPQLVTVVVAVQLITSKSLPSDSLSANCVSSLTANINCARQVGSFLPGVYKPADVLEEACTVDCASSLAQYQTSVEAACSDQDTFLIEENREAPASFIPEILFYNFNRTCIQDEGRWCSVVSKSFADGDVAAPTRLSSNGSSAVKGVSKTLLIFWKQQQAGRQEAVDLCDNCVIKQLQFQAGSPINDGFLLQSKYSSLTSSCSKTGFPLATSTTPFPASPAPTDPTRNCSGTFYTVQAGDTCQSISESQGVGTAWLLYDNGLDAFCANFPTSGGLCIQNKCSTYTVQANDTCLSIASERGLSQVQVNTWNPILGSSCRFLNMSLGDSICVTPPGEPDYVVPNITATTTSVPSATAAPVPGNLAPNTTDHCALYYEVLSGDYCNKLVVKYSISLEDFLFLNPHVNSNCTNLWADYSYCVKPVGSVDLYPGNPNYVPPTESYSTIPYDSLPKATYTPPAITGLPVLLPLAEGTRTDCFVYADGGSLTPSFDLAESFFTSACEAIASGWSISLAQLENWNPSLQTNSTACAPQAGYRYCVSQWNGASYTVTKTVETVTPLPIRDGATADCKDYTSVVSGITCQNVLDRNEITIEQFYAWNPAVGAQCGNLWTGYRYCIRVDDIIPDPDADDSTSVPSTTDGPTTTVSSPTTSAAQPTATAPGPTQDGIAANCNSWHIAGDGLFCYDISVKYGITLEQFYEWNPAAAPDCGGLWGGYAYCVGVSS